MASGQRTATRGGRPGARGEDAETCSQACLLLVRELVAQPPAKAGPEASLEIQRLQSAGRPCYEADNSACRGEWRREAGSPRGAQCRHMGKRAWRAPTPASPPSGLTPDGGLALTRDRLLARRHGRTAMICPKGPRSKVQAPNKHQGPNPARTRARDLEAASSSSRRVPGPWSFSGACCLQLGALMVLTAWRSEAGPPPTPVSPRRLRRAWPAPAGWPEGLPGAANLPARPS